MRTCFIPAVLSVQQASTTTTTATATTRISPFVPSLFAEPLRMRRSATGRSERTRHRLRATLPETTDHDMEAKIDTSGDGDTFPNLELQSHDTMLETLPLTTINLDTNATTTITTTTTTASSWLAQWTREIPPESVLWLNAVAVIWGTQHPVIKMVVEDCDPSAFSLVRFALAALIASPFTPKLTRSTTQKSELTKEPTDPALAWRWGAEMGLWMFLGYAFQAVGLGFTTAQRSGFLLYLNVKFVPFFARILLGREISIPTWLSALTAVVGTALLAYDGSSLDLNVGDLWSIAAAATSAMFILRLEAASAAVPNSAALNAACLWVVTGAALVWSLGQGRLVTHSCIQAMEQVGRNVIQTISSHPVELIYLSAVTTALANYIQTRAQRNVSAERASVIYAMDPVYGAFFSNLLLGEQLNGMGIVGAGLITLAAATNAFMDLGNRTVTKVNGVEEDSTDANGLK